MYHTLGQRKGLGIGGTKDGGRSVVRGRQRRRKQYSDCRQGHDHPRLMSVGLIAQQLHWV
jgi:tRNA-specific 2-thiouridylase